MPTLSRILRHTDSGSGGEGRKNVAEQESLKSGGRSEVNGAKRAPPTDDAATNTTTVPPAGMVVVEDKSIKDRITKKRNRSDAMGSDDKPKPPPPTFGIVDNPVPPTDAATNTTTVPPTQQAKDGSGFNGSGGGQRSARGQSGHRSLSGNVGAEQQGMNDNDYLMGNFNMPSVFSGSGRGGNHSSFVGDAMNDPDRKVRIRNKQQRLLLLHHSSKCLYEDGKCKITPYCGEMKKLWEHLARCTDNDCRVAHCFSSRRILTHFRTCAYPRCPVCGPVRETVRKSQKSPRAQSQHPGGGVQMPGLMGIDGNSCGMSHDVRAGMQMSSSMMQPANNNNSTGSAMQMGSMMDMMQGTDCNMGVSDSMGLQSLAPIDRMMTGGVNNYGAIEVNTMNSSVEQNQSSMLMGPRHQNQPQSHGKSNWSAGIIGQMLPPPNDHRNNIMDANGHSNISMDPDTQSLLLLCHASKCTAENSSTYTITPYCAEMKELWKHIASCKVSYCKVKHCMSSRYVLSQLNRCKPPCNICDPVKEIIKNEYQLQTNKQKIGNDSFSSSTGRMPAPTSLSVTSQHSGLPQSLNTEKIPGQSTDVPPSSDNGITQSRQQSPRPNAPNPNVLGSGVAGVNLTMNAQVAFVPTTATTILTASTSTTSAAEEKTTKKMDASARKEEKSCIDNEDPNSSSRMYGAKKNHSDDMGNDYTKKKPPPPTVLATDGTICLRGKLVRNTTDELSLDKPAPIHRISGLWAMEGLSKILDEPDKCERFEYEHKCSFNSNVFPLSGPYTGFFFYTNVFGEQMKIHERDVKLKFILNSGGYYNVEGRGRNDFGKYTVTGTLMDFTITLSRIYQAPKEKATKKSPAIDNADGGGVHCNDEVISISSDDASDVEDVTELYLAQRNEELQKMIDDAELIDDAERLKEENESVMKANAQINTSWSHAHVQQF